MKKIKVGIVNYLNTAPLIYGLKNSSIIDSIELIPDYPSNLANYLVDESIDIGLVPVAVIPQLDQWCLVSDYCIGCNGPVASVGIFSDVPLPRVDRILLDYQSRTSVELAKWLISDFWKLDVPLVEADENYQDQISGATAGLVIGDRSFKQKRKSKYVYDLGEAWKLFTGLPFVFAAWVSNRPMTADFIELFNEANASGINNISNVISSLDLDIDVDLEEYFKKYISYELDSDKRKALRMFLQHLKKDIIV